MGKKDKQGELWDDSALINAFDDAISNYMKVHAQESQNSSANKEKAISSQEENASALVERANDAERNAETNDETTISSSAPAEIDETGNLSSVKETSCLGSDAPENVEDLSTEQYIHQEHGSYSLSQSTEDYNQLVNKYYELEDQRQKILQQLNQFGYLNNYSTATTINSQEAQPATSQAYPAISSSFCPYGCQSWVAPCTSLPCYSSGGACVPKSSNGLAEAASSRNEKFTASNDFVKTAMFTAEGALSSLKEQAYTNSGDSVNEGKEKQLETNLCHVEKSSNSETDLAVVLNAWYSAGFYTGKYLSEQSFAKNRHG